MQHSEHAALSRAVCAGQEAYGDHLQELPQYVKRLEPEGLSEGRQMGVSWVSKGLGGVILKQRPVPLHKHRSLLSVVPHTRLIPAHQITGAPVKGSL